MVAKKIAKKVTKGGNKATTSALKKATDDSKLVHKFLDMAAHQKGAPKSMIKVADKENEALKKGISAAKAKSH
jgi:hypothetical protein